MMIHKHKEIDVGDTVEYNDGEYIVEYIWNHGSYQWWFDLTATNTMIEGLDIYKTEKSVHSTDCKLIRKKNV